MSAIKAFGSALHKAVEGFLDVVIGIVTDGFVIEEEEGVPQPPAPPFGGSIPRRILFLIDYARRKKLRDERDVMDILQMV